MMEGARGRWGMLLQCRISLHLWTLYCSCKWHIAKAELFPEEIQSHLVPEISQKLQLLDFKISKTKGAYISSGSS